MTPELRRMAEEAGFTIENSWGYACGGTATLEAFARLVAADCAKMCDSVSRKAASDAGRSLARECRDAIRAHYKAP